MTPPPTPPTTPTEPPKPPAGAPEKYADWKLPDGFDLDKVAAEEIGPLFKELNLTQDQAQKLIDTYAKNALKTNQDALDYWKDQRAKWRDEVKAHPQLGKLVGTNGNYGPDSPLVRTVNQALDGLQNPRLAAAFKEAMELTGAGDHPAFVEVLYTLASKVTEGTSYVRGEPVNSGRGARPSPGAAMYPNLQSEADRR